MAAETLTDLLYSTMSDVWSFGVTFWEVRCENELVCFYGDHLNYNTAQIHLYCTPSPLISPHTDSSQVLTLGDHPYVDVAPNFMVQHLRGGYRLMQPEVLLLCSILPSYHGISRDRIFF